MATVVTFLIDWRLVRRRLFRIGLDVRLDPALDATGALRIKVQTRNARVGRVDASAIYAIGLRATRSTSADIPLWPLPS